MPFKCKTPHWFFSKGRVGDGKHITFNQVLKTYLFRYGRFKKIGRRGKEGYQLRSLVQVSIDLCMKCIMRNEKDSESPGTRCAAVGEDFGHNIGDCTPSATVFCDNEFINENAGILEQKGPMFSAICADKELIKSIIVPCNVILPNLNDAACIEQEISISSGLGSWSDNFMQYGGDEVHDNNSSEVSVSCVCSECAQAGSIADVDCIDVNASNEVAEQIGKQDTYTTALQNSDDCLCFNPETMPSNGDADATFLRLMQEEESVCPSSGDDQLSLRCHGEKREANDSGDMTEGGVLEISISSVSDTLKVDSIPMSSGSTTENLVLNRRSKCKEIDLAEKIDVGSAQEIREITKLLPDGVSKNMMNNEGKCVASGMNWKTVDGRNEIEKHEIREKSGMECVVYLCNMKDKNEQKTQRGVVSALEASEDIQYETGVTLKSTSQNFLRLPVEQEGFATRDNVFPSLQASDNKPPVDQKAPASKECSQSPSISWPTESTAIETEYSEAHGDRESSFNLGMIKRLREMKGTEIDFMLESEEVAFVGHANSSAAQGVGAYPHNFTSLDVRHLFMNEHVERRRFHDEDCELPPGNTREENVLLLEGDSESIVARGTKGVTDVRNCDAVIENCASRTSQVSIDQLRGPGFSAKQVLSQPQNGQNMSVDIFGREKTGTDTIGAPFSDAKCLNLNRTANCLPIVGKAGICKSGRLMEKDASEVCYFLQKARDLYSKPLEVLENNTQNRNICDASCQSALFSHVIPLGERTNGDELNSPVARIQYTFQNRIKIKPSRHALNFQPMHEDSLASFAIRPKVQAYACKCMCRCNSSTSQPPHFCDSSRKVVRPVATSCNLREGEEANPCPLRKPNMFTNDVDEVTGQYERVSSSCPALIGKRDGLAGNDIRGNVSPLMKTSFLREHVSGYSGRNTSCGDVNLEQKQVRLGHPRCAFALQLADRLMRTRKPLTNCRPSNSPYRFRRHQRMILDARLRKQQKFPNLKRLLQTNCTTCSIQDQKEKSFQMMPMNVLATNSLNLALQKRITAAFSPMLQYAEVETPMDKPSLSGDNELFIKKQFDEEICPLNVESRNPIQPPLPQRAEALRKRLEEERANGELDKEKIPLDQIEGLMYCTEVLNVNSCPLYRLDHTEDDLKCSNFKFCLNKHMEDDCTKEIGGDWYESPEKWSKIPFNTTATEEWNSFVSNNHQVGKKLLDELYIIVSIVSEICNKHTGLQVQNTLPIGAGSC